jgi:hypothetical protein
MSDEPLEETNGEESEVPEGAAVFPLIPGELGIDPLLLGVLHATVFLAGSTEEVVNTAAADEAVAYLGEYIRRLQGDRLRGVREDMATLIAFAREEKWPKQDIQTLKSLLEDFGVEKEEGEA